MNGVCVMCVRGYIYIYKYIYISVDETCRARGVGGCAAEGAEHGDEKCLINRWVVAHLAQRDLQPFRELLRRHADADGSVRGDGARSAVRGGGEGAVGRRHKFGHRVRPG